MYGIMYYHGTERKKMYCTNTNFIDSFSEDIESVAKVVQKKTAEAAVRSMYKRGNKDQLYVIEIINVEVRLEEVPRPAEKEGFVIINPSSRYGSGEYYSGAKKPTTYRIHDYSVLEGASTFKTEKEAQKCLDALNVFFDEDIEYYSTKVQNNGFDYVGLFQKLKEELYIRKL